MKNKQQPFFIDVDQAAAVIYAQHKLHGFEGWMRKGLEIASALVLNSHEKKGEEIKYATAVQILQDALGSKMGGCRQKGFHGIIQAWKLLRFTHVGPFEATIDGLNPDADAIKGNSTVVSRTLQHIRA